MNGARVVVTGLGAVSPFGVGVDALWRGLDEGRSGLAAMPGREAVAGLGPSVAGLVTGVDPAVVPRTFRRAMARMGIFAYLAAREALADAGLDPDAAPPDMGVAVGQTMGSPDTMAAFFTDFVRRGSLEGTRSATFFKIMGHGAAASLAMALGLRGRVSAPSAACAAGVVAVGEGFESVAAGRQTMTLCGGAEEFNVLTAATFDLLQAASRNPDPATASRPFDAARDGVVCAEGAGLLLLEEYGHARRRGARIWAEVVGYAANGAPRDLVYPDADAIRACMAACLDDAGVAADAVSLIGAHATSTVEGDRAEARAVAALFGGGVPVSALKGQLGHAMAAGGALEMIAGLRMMQDGVVLPNQYLRHPDPTCAGVCLPTTRVRRPLTFFLKNAFALGGVNACVLLRRVD